MVMISETDPSLCFFFKKWKFQNSKELKNTKWIDNMRKKNNQHVQSFIHTKKIDAR